MSLANKLITLNQIVTQRQLNALKTKDRQQSMIQKENKNCQDINKQWILQQQIVNIL